MTKHGQTSLPANRVIWPLFLTLACLGGCGLVTPEPLSKPMPPTPTPVRVTQEASLTPTPTTSITPIVTPTPVMIEATPASVAYALPLTVQHVTETTATFLFELEAPSQGILVCEPVEAGRAAQIVLPLAEEVVRHQIVLDNLEPGVVYQAAVGLNDGTGVYRQPPFMDSLWGSVRFRTPSADRPLRIGVIGDSGFGQPETYRLVEQMATYDLDFVLHTGDVVYQIYNNADPLEAYQLKYYLPFSPLLHQMPIYPVVGNHDVESAALWQGQPFYYYAFPPFPDPRFALSDQAGRNQWYAFAYGDVQFLALDSQVFYGETGRAEQDAWLAERLNDGRFAYSIVVLHIPPYSSSKVHPFDGLPVRQAWVPLFEAANVPLVLAGHSHNYERLAMGEMSYVISGGGSATLYAVGDILPGSQRFATRTHFVLLEIDTAQISVTAIALDGEILDTAALMP